MKANTRPLATAVALLAGCLTAPLASAQQVEEGYEVPRTHYGVPDFQGTWRNPQIISLERPEELGEQRAYTDEEARAIERAAQQAVEEDNQPLDPDRPAPPAEDLPPVGNYDLFWTDRGMNMPTIDGEYRTSIIIDPPDGRIPDYTEEFRARRAEERANSPDSLDGPEGRPLGERCLLSFGSLSGPPMLPVMYNSHYQIVQSPGYVVIVAEMVNDARIIRIDGEHGVNAKLDRWMGDSVGRWDGDTLVIETQHFNPQQDFRGASENLKVTERLTRVDEDKIHYRFTVQDPTTFQSDFTGELALESYDEPLFEYACHEGNYSLPGTLGGARREEAEAAQQQQ